MTPQEPPKLGPLARRIQANQPKPEPSKPAWMKHLTAKDNTGQVRLP